MHEPTDNIVDTLFNFIDFKLNGVFTGIPARVTSVDLERNCLDAQPLIRRKDSDQSQHTLPEVYDVPFQILSADTGKFKITMPIRVGDTVQLQYSQRDLAKFYGSDGKTVVDSLSVLAHQSNPVLAIPCMFTRTNPTEVRSDALVLQAGTASIVMTEDGGIDIRSTSLTHNGVNVGSTHRHGGVESGPSTTSTPV